MTDLTTQEIFDQLVLETSIYSNPDKVVEHSLFDELKKREDAIDVLIESLKWKPTIAALVSLSNITGEKVVAESHRGIIPKMVIDWLKWYDTKNGEKE